MKKALLGKTTLEVSRLAVGCWQLSPRFWGEVDPTDWKRAMDAAAEGGINLVDTADAYGDGGAEEALGAYFAERGNRDHWVVASKFYWDFTTPLPETYSIDRFPHTSHKYITAACEASLKRLLVESIDLYQLHAWDPLLCPEEVARAVTELKDAGKIRYFGVSNLNVEQMRMLEAVIPVDTLQPKYSLLDRGPEAREFPFCLERKIGVLAYSPLERGLLSGRITTGSRFPDARARSERFSPASLKRLVPRLEKVARLADSLGLTLPQFAIRWLLTHPAVTVALIGTKKPEHVSTLTGAADAMLPPAVWHEAAACVAGA